MTFAISGAVFVAGRFVLFLGIVIGNPLPSYFIFFAVHLIALAIMV